MYKNKFVLSIISDGSPVKETGYRSKKEVAIPFDSDYKIRLKNKNDRSCTARVFVDGKKVSQLGDFIITAGGSVDLERFVDRSLDSGKKFKFVPLDHKDVDDPTNLDNGIIEVEFRLAKVRNGIKMLPPKTWTDAPPLAWRDTLPYYDSPRKDFWDDNNTSGGFQDNNISAYYCSSGDLGHPGSSCSLTANGGYGSGGPLKKQKSVDAGATIEGGNSVQSFTYSDLQVDDNHVVTLRLKIVGLNKEIPMKKYKYCANCGTKVNRLDKYCSECGHRRRNSA